MEATLTVICSDAFPPFALVGGFARDAFNRITKLARNATKALRVPVVELNLMLDGAATNHPFFQRITREFYSSASRPHPTMPLVPAKHFGIALCPVQREPDWYFNAIEASGRRNVRKAIKLGYTFRRFDYNAHLEDITAIHRSTDIRQGKALPPALMAAATPINNPPSQDPRHDYPYFGVFKEGKLVAYLSCLVAGELGAIETIYGHAAHQENGVVPLLLTSAAHAISTHHPSVRFINYGTYYGAGATMQRFKRKFQFRPHRVRWRL